MAIGDVKDISILRPNVIKREKDADERRRNRRDKRSPEEPPKEKADPEEGKISIRV